MAQFDVHRNIGVHKDSIPFVMVVQSSLKNESQLNRGSLGRTADTGLVVAVAGPAMAGTDDQNKQEPEEA